MASYNIKKFLIYCLIFFIFIFFILFRNLKSLTVPSLYAEDSMWISMIIFNGFFDTTINAREGFPVFNLVLLDYLALILNNLSFKTFLDLPYSILIISTFFYLIVASAPIIFLSEKYQLKDKILLSLFALLIPLGSTGSEVFGKIGNLVFLFPILSTYLILFYKSKNTFFRFFVITFILFLNAITFPVCFLLLIFFFFYIHIIEYCNNQKFNLLINLKRSLILLFSIFICLYLYPTNFISFEGGASMSFKLSGFIDMGISRMILYPFIAAFYKSMNDYLSILFVLVIFVCLCILIYKKTLIVFLRSDAFVVCVGFLLFFLSTIVMRSGFTSWFGNYDNTFPDRYFYGINILFIQFLFLFFIEYHFVKKFILIIFFINIIFYSSKIFEFTNPKYNYEKYGSFTKMFCDMENEHIKESIKIDGEKVLIPIYPVDHQFIFTFNVPYSEYYKMKKEC